MSLTLAEIRLFLELLREKYGPGYANDYRRDPNIARLQAKLSIMLEAKSRG